jgi:hypothetical protein
LSGNENLGEWSLISDEFKRSLSSGRTIVVIGDVWKGNLAESRGQSGGFQSLKRGLLELAGAVDALDEPTINLADAHAAAARYAPESTIALLKRSLQVGPDSTSAYRRVILGPWERIYDLSGANLSDFLNGDLRRGIVFTDATQEFRIEHKSTQLVYLCGTVSRPAEMEFSVPNGAGTSTRDLWFRQFCADLISRPVLVIAERSHTELWAFLRARTNSVNFRISSGFYLSGAMSGADRLRADNCALTPMAADLSRVASAWFASSVVEISNGHRALARIRHSDEVGVGALLVTRLLRNKEGPSWDFLRGHDPRWADIAAGRLVRLSRTRSLHGELNLEEGKRNVVLLKGRVGSGKTALLMRLAYELEAKGYTLAWVDRSASNKLASIIAQVLELEPDAVFVDDLDIFGERSQEFVRRLNQSGRILVVTAVRNTRMWALGSTNGMRIVDGDAELADKDLKGLIEKLTEAGLLGELLGLQPESARIDRLRDLSHRDLLAGLIQVVTGQPFEDRVKSEFEQLEPLAQHAYALVCFWAARVNEATHLPEADLLQMVTSAPQYAATLELVNNLVGSRLLLREAAGLRVRHRAIADAVVRGLPKVTIGDIVRSMLGFYAARAANMRDPSHPDRRQMIHLLSHSHMVDLDLSQSIVRSIYEDVQPLLSNDFHYWLQRGAYEVERGDLDLADSYLESARGCEGGAQDYKVTTEWGFMRLLKATVLPSDQRAQAGARSAVEALIQVARREGKNSPHTFTILVRRGVEWLEVALLSDAERLRIASRIREIADLGLSVCRDNREFSRVAREFDQRLTRLTAYVKPAPKFPLP